MKSLNQESLGLIFTQARSHNGWLKEAVSDQLLHEIYDVFKMGPTSMNDCPARIVFVKSAEQKAKLVECMMAGNVEKTKTAPVVAIIAYDLEFYEKLPKLFPHMPDAKSMFVGNEELIKTSAVRDGTLQGAYFLIAARALGLDCGPMAGFDKKKVDEAFFAGTKWKSNFVCALGYGDVTKLHPRGPRLPFEEACKII